jgi:hypothetical protein
MKLQQSAIYDLKSNLLNLNTIKNEKPPMSEVISMQMQHKSDRAYSLVSPGVFL